MYGRTPDQSGYNDGTTGPADDTNGVTLDWWETLAAATSAPAVDGDRAYVAAEQLYGIDVDEGRIDWELELDDSFEGRPVLAGGYVLAYERDWSGDTTRLHAVDAENGTRRWDEPVSEGATPPVADEAQVYVGDEDDVRALALSTGEEQWTFSPTEPIATSPALADDVLYVGTEEEWGENTSYLHAIDVDSGDDDWTAEPGSGDVTDVVVGDGLVFVSTENGDVRAYGTDGTVEWIEHEVSGSVEYLAVDDERLYAATNDGITALDPTSGGEEWSESVGHVSDKPAVSTAGLFVGTHDDDVFVLEPTSGDVSWKRINDAAISGPVVTGDRAFIGGSRTLRTHTTGDLPETTVPDVPEGHWRFDGYDAAGTSHNPTADTPDADADGPSLRWWRTFDEPASAPAIDGDTAYVAAEDLYALETEDGSVRWQYEADDDFTGDRPVITGDIVFGIEREWGGDPARLHAIDATNGSLRWDSDLTEPTQHPVAGEEQIFVTAGESVRAHDLRSGRQEWRFELREPPTTTPVLAGDRLYVGTEEAWDDDEAYVYAINAATGNGLWRTSHQDGGDVSSMAGSDDALYVAYETGGVVAYDHDGEELWSHDSSADRFDHVGTDGERVYVATDDSPGVTALDTADGSVVGRTSSVDRAISPPVSTPSGVLVGTESNDVVLLDLESDETVWRRQHDDSAALVAVEGDVYAGGGPTLRVHSDGPLSTVEPEAVGPLAWHAAGRTMSQSGYTGDESGPIADDTLEQLWSVDTDYDQTTPPASDGEVGYVAADSLFAYELRSGERVWEYETDEYLEAVQPVIAGQTVLAIERDWGGETETIHAVNRKTGDGRWTAPVDDGARSPVAGDDLVFVASGSHVEARSLFTGDQVWRFELEEDVGTDPALSLSDGRLYVGTEADWSSDVAHVYAINAATGNGLWRTHRDGGDVTSLAVSDSGDTVYAVFDADGVVAYDRNGDEQWRHDSSAARFEHVGTDGETVYVATAEYPGISALDAETGDLVWRNGVNGAITTRPAISDQAVFVGTDESELVALATDTGNVHWQRTYDGPAASPVVSGNRIYVGGESSTLRAFSDAVPPVAELEYEDPVLVDEPTVFDATASQPGDAPISEYRWDFTGDGEIDATGSQVEYTFEDERPYEVRLLVVDENGIADVERQHLTVSDDPLEKYRDDGAVETSGLRKAIDDWRTNEIETGLLRDVIDAWRSS
ncbi:PQQ-binding-like beta-propeller repeat protein [Natronobeatus ordinarius]|uniref:outer membrane protein assembly factor BamB family protein n=1 Tax=Natronobeatus ordinarius TaxID=2963433 RepID=UPI0020CC2F91|nr:PQQ-binding-like beta-propeller repeat protein [Natronobeatus ordinarius]